MLTDQTSRYLSLIAELRSDLSECRLQVLVQAEVIRAQRENLDAAREALGKIKLWLEESEMTYSMHNGIRTENEMYVNVRAALEGVEAETTQTKETE